MMNYYEGVLDTKPRPALAVNRTEVVFDFYLPTSLESALERKLWRASMSATAFNRKTWTFVNQCREA